jgi:hypothetical protein
MHKLKSDASAVRALPDDLVVGTICRSPEQYNARFSVAFHVHV